MEQGARSDGIDQAKLRELPTLCLFGKPCVIAGDRYIDGFATKRSAYLLARVAISRQRRMLRSELADILWPGDYFDATRLRLRQELTRLRKTLDEFSEIVSTQGDWVGVDTSRVNVDVEEFEIALRRSRSETEPARREEALRYVIQVSGRPFLEGSQEDWIEAERSRLNELRYAAMVDLAALLVKQTHLEEALLFARQAVNLLPARESAHLLVMQILGELGHMADALTQYQVLRRHVAEASGGRLSDRAEQLAASLREPGVEEPLPLLIEPVWPGIPVAPEPIFGREEETGLIADRLDPQSGSARLVTLLGVGGIGKTHLLLHASRTLSHVYRGKVLFVDLTEIADSNLAPVAIRKAFGPNHRPSDDPVVSLLNSIPNEPFLLALDNLEQLGPSFAPVLRRLLAERPQLRILASSRTALNLSGEFRLVLSPLPLPPAAAGKEDSQASPAMQLFASTVEAGRVGTRINPADWPTISDIVRLLEGVPLALQLAASRFHMLGAQGLLKALTERAELTNSRQDAPTRHRTIRSAVSGSIDELHPELKRAMECLAMFRGGWTLEAAADVCESANAMRIMERLLDASLVYIASEGARIRFRMLESIRQYILSNLEQSEIVRLRGLHLNWIRAVAKGVANDIITLDGLARLDALEPETDNIREACNFALESSAEAAFELGANLAHFWVYRSTCFEANLFYFELFERYRDYEPSETVLRASYGQCVISLMLDLPEWRAMIERTLAIGIEINDVKWRVKTLVQLLNEAQNVMHYDRCRDYIRQMAEFAAVHGHHDDEGFVLRARGNFTYFQGDRESALADFREGLAWFEKRGCVFSIARMKLHISRAAMESGDYEEASRALKGLLQHVRETRFTLLDAAVCESEGRLQLRLGNLDAAMDYFNQSEAGWRQGFYRFQVAAQFNHRGRVYLAMGNLTEASRSFADAAEMWLAMNYPVAVSVALYGMSAVCLEWGRIDEAAKLFAAALQGIAMIGAKIVPFEQDFADQTGAAIRALGGDVEVESPLKEAVELARRLVPT